MMDFHLCTQADIISGTIRKTNRKSYEKGRNQSQDRKAEMPEISVSDDSAIRGGSSVRGSGG